MVFSKTWLIHVQEREEEQSWFLSIRGFSCFASSGLSSSNTDDAWHFEVKGSPSVALELLF
jgi:hypothetical protein